MEKNDEWIITAQSGLPKCQTARKSEPWAEVLRKGYFTGATGTGAGTGTGTGATGAGK